MLPSRLFFDDSFFKGDESIKSDIYEKDGNIVLEMEAPGYTKDDIDISIDKGTLSISFEKEEEDEENKKYLHRERKSYSKVSRSFYLGDIDEEDIEGKITGNGSKILAFTSLTVAMGGDNLGIFIPYFTGKSLIEIGISLVIFTLGILILCKLSQSLASISAIGEIVEKYEKIIVPVVFIGLGLYILIENGTINYFISLITS